MAQMTMVQAINNALKTELENDENDENVVVFGEDVGFRYDLPLWSTYNGWR